MASGNSDKVCISTSGARLILEAIGRPRRIGLSAAEKEALFRAKEVRHLVYRLGLGSKGFGDVLEAVARGRKPRQAWLVPYFQQYQDYSRRAGKLLGFLGQMEKEKENVLGSALTLARRYLDDDAYIEAEVELVLGGGADACGINRIDPRPILIDLAQFTGNVDEMTRIMAHELHHKADSWSSETRREVYWILEQGPREILQLYTLASELIGEGIAVFLTFPSRFSRLYQEQAGRMPDLYREVESGILKASMGMHQRSFDTLYSKLYNQAGPLYMVGCDMAKTIEDELGHDHLVSCSAGVASFFEAYRESCRSAGRQHHFSETVYKQARYLSHYLQQL